MKNTWVLVADQSAAKLFRVTGTKLNPELVPVDVLEHPEVLGTDPSSSGMHASFVDMSGRDDEERRRFVRQVVDRLKQGHTAGELRELYVAAPAGFVGELRGHYSAGVRRCVRREIIGDYIHEARAQLEARMRKREWLGA